ncbi:MAG TPA: hypothetical protein VEL07_10705 [Planctomycetota bacterium]|nr:hypothetical protein [Planctomycetota bacterium]
MIRVLALFALTVAVACGADGRTPLHQVLDSLRAEGLTIVSSDALVRADIAVPAPAGATPRERLDRALDGTGLRAVAGPRDSWLVVGDPPKAAAPAAVVSQILVTSDKVEDVSSLDAWAKTFIKPGMSDREKAIAVWETVVKFRHQEQPPNEYNTSAGSPHDPIKSFNVYGYNMCCCASACVEALARRAGLEARGRIINNHSVPEVKFDGEWHLLDASLICYFPRPDGVIASVNDIADSVDAWNTQRGGAMDDAALRAFMRGGGWRNGPEVLRGTAAYNDNGWLAAGTHGWYATMHEYAGIKRDGIYEYGTAVGYRVNVQLRPGERITRSWSNRGLHANMDEGWAPGVMTKASDVHYAAAYGDVAPGRMGNGVHEWAVPLRQATLVGVALECSGVRDGKTGLVVADAAKPGVIVLRVPTSYVFLTGAASVTAAPAAGGAVVVELSDNNGLDWKPVATIDAAGARDLDLNALVLRRYDYRLRLTLTGAGTALSGLALRHDIQCSQRALPALTQGENRIAYASGDEGTITVEGALIDNGGRNLRFTDFHPTLVGVEENLLKLTGPTGSATVAVATPGDMKRLRLGAHFRARDAKDGYDVKASFDEGRTWLDVGRLAGPTAGTSVAMAIDAPKGARAALVRLDGQQSNTTCLFDLRIDADYVEPASRVAPVAVTYVWEEDGVEKRERHVATKATDAWTITCAGKPLLKDLIVELAP